MLNVSELRMTEQKKPLFFYQRLSVRWVIRLGYEPSEIQISKSIS